MKKIINGKRYDTESATKIGEATAPEHQGDFRWWHEELYVTPRSRRFFIAGEGHAMSRWGERVPGNMMGPGSGILPVTEQDALEWAERYLDPEVVEKYFGDMIEDA